MCSLRSSLRRWIAEVIQFANGCFFLGVIFKTIVKLSCYVNSKSLVAAVWNWQKKSGPWAGNSRQFMGMVMGCDLAPAAGPAIQEDQNKRAAGPGKWTGAAMSGYAKTRRSARALSSSPSMTTPTMVIRAARIKENRYAVVSAVPEATSQSMAGPAIKVPARPQLRKKVALK